MSKYDSITDFLLSLGFEIRGESFVNEKLQVAFFASALAGHTVESFAALAKERGWIQAEKGEERQELQPGGVVPSLFTFYHFTTGCSFDEPDLWPTLHTGLKEVKFKAQLVPVPDPSRFLKKTVRLTHVWNLRDGPCPYKVGQRQVRTITNPFLGEMRTYTGLVTQVVEHFDTDRVEWVFEGEEVES